MLLRKLDLFDAGKKAIEKLAVIVTYAMATNVFFLLLEIFTAAYSGIPESRHHLAILFTGIEGNAQFVPWMWMSGLLSVIALVILFIPGTRKNHALLAIACMSVFFGIWMEKGLVMVVSAFTHTPLGGTATYAPSMNELAVSLGIYSIGALILTVLYKIATTVRSREPDTLWQESTPPSLSEGAATQ